MPLYDFYCDCGYEADRLVGIYEPNPICPTCGSTRKKAVGSNIMVKMKGEGGYPSRRRQVFNTTKQNHPPLEHKRNKVSFGMS